MAESVNALYKTEVVRKQGPWPSFEQLELVTTRWVECYNKRRLHSPIGNLPPAEFEEIYYRALAEAAARFRPSPDAPGRMPHDSGFARRRSRGCSGPRSFADPSKSGFFYAYRGSRAVTIDRSGPGRLLLSLQETQAIQTILATVSVRHES